RPRLGPSRRPAKAGRRGTLPSREAPPCPSNVAPPSCASPSATSCQRVRSGAGWRRDSLYRQKGESGQGTGRVPGGRSNLRVASRGVNSVSTEPNVSYVTGPVASRWGQPRLGKQNGRLRDCATPHVEVGEVREADLRQRGGGPEQSPNRLGRRQHEGVGQ